MAQQFSELSDKHIQFIEKQKIFFVGTATEAGRVNVSPKGMDSLYVVDNRRVAWLNVTGSNNESSAHVQRCPRMTLMFCSFEDKPWVLRLYGSAKVFHRKDPEWKQWIHLFKNYPGARQIFLVTLNLVQTSCGMSVPYYKYIGERQALNTWANIKGEEGVREFWKTRNMFSIDGLPTRIIERST